MTLPGSFECNREFSKKVSPTGPLLSDSDKSCYSPRPRADTENLLPFVDDYETKSFSAGRCNRAGAVWIHRIGSGIGTEADRAIIAVRKFCGKTARSISGEDPDMGAWKAGDCSGCGTSALEESALLNPIGAIEAGKRACPVVHFDAD